MSKPLVLLHALKLSEGPQQQLAGNYQHTHNLALWLSRNPSISLRVLCDEHSAPTLRSELPSDCLEYVSLRRSTVFWADMAVIRATKRLQPALYHRPTGQLPFFPMKCRTVATIADLNFASLPTSPGKRIYKELSYRWTIRKADAITCVSNFTKDSVVRYFHVHPRKIAVIHHGTTVLPPPTHVAIKNIPGRIWLTFGHQQHKNVEACIQGLEARCHDEHLVVLGKGAYIEDTLKPLAERRGLSSRIHFLGTVSSCELHGLYRSATGLLFLSRYEGFGLPLLEAMSSGCPVIGSNVCSIPEVVGDAALLVPPDDASSIAIAMEQVASDGHLRAKLIARGLERTRVFTWEHAAAKTIALYFQVLSGCRATKQGGI